MTPEGWRSSSLADVVASITTGVSVNSESRPRGEGEVGVLKTSAVTYGRFLVDENKVVLKEELARARERPQAGSILLSRMNTPLLVGASAYVDRDWPDLVLPDRIWQIRTHPQRADGRWLQHLLASPDVRTRLTEAASGTSGSMKNLSQEKFLKLSVLTPPLGEQRKIAAILSSVDDAIESTQAVIDQLGVVKKAMMAELLTRGLPGRHTRFKQTEFGEIPESWKVVRLRDLASVITKGTTPTTYGHPYTASGVRFIRVENITEDAELDLAATKYISDECHAELSRSQLKPGDLLFSIAGALGRAAAVPDDLGPANTNQAVSLVRLHDPAERRFVLWALLGPQVAQQVGRARAALAQANLSLAQVGDLQIPMPELSERPAVAHVLDALCSRVSAERERLVGLHQVRTALMSVLLTGEVRVKTHEGTA